MCHVVTVKNFWHIWDQIEIVNTVFESWTVSLKKKPINAQQVVAELTRATRRRRKTLGFQLLAPHFSWDKATQCHFIGRSVGQSKLVYQFWAFCPTSKGGYRRSEKIKVLLIMMTMTISDYLSCNHLRRRLHQWAVGWVVVVSQKIASAISNSFYVLYCPKVAHIPNFIRS